MILRALEARLSTLFNTPSGDRSSQPDEHQLQLATAVLLVEVMRSDADIAQVEREAIIAVLQDRFSLASNESAALLARAQAQADNAFDFQHFTALLNKGFSIEQKVRIVEYLWQVAYADGHLSDHEHHVMRKIANLLYIPHGDYIAAKERAKAAFQG